MAGEIKFRLRVWLWTILVSVDQTLNVVLSPLMNRAFRTHRFGHEDETLSSVLGKEAREGNRRARLVCRLLHWFDRHHCEKNIEEGVGHDR